jgi:hypothetical protein
MIHSYATNRLSLTKARSWIRIAEKWWEVQFDHPDLP